MGSVPVQRTWVTGEIVTAAEMNSNIRDSVNFLLTTPRCILGLSTLTTVSDSTTPTSIIWDTLYVNTDNMSSPPSNRMYAKTAGRFEFEFYVHYNAFTTTISTVMCGIQYNNSTAWGSGTKLDEDVRQTTGANNGGIFGTSTSVRADTFMNAGDFVSFWTAQSGAGASLTISGGSPFNMSASGRWIASS